ncbi:hypothetical protein EDD22DRAFT_951873 [Suillus occidentalis]|nr:hypothetical protein EDD22DRAFT_951873 [Suillus occidentalis]
MILPHLHTSFAVVPAGSTSQPCQSTNSDLADGLPFGSIGPSGSGYHTRGFTFGTFVHFRASLDSPNDWSSSLNNLANQLSTRFALRHVGHTSVLFDTFVHFRASLDSPNDWSSSLNNLANQLSTRFALRHVGHTRQSSSLNSLAVLLSTRFDHRGDAEDLDQAIARQREALALYPVGHTDRSKYCSPFTTHAVIFPSPPRDRLVLGIAALHSPCGHLPFSAS